MQTAKPLLIPLTSSLYVPGKLADAENVLVDVGARYYVEKVRDTPLQAACSRPDFCFVAFAVCQGCENFLQYENTRSAEKSRQAATDHRAQEREQADRSGVFANAAICAGKAAHSSAEQG